MSSSPATPHGSLRVKTPEELNVILATDCGSTTTKAILIEKVNAREAPGRLGCEGD